MSKTISAGKNPNISIDEIKGDLSIVGWDGEDILVKIDNEENLRFTQDGENVSLSCDDDLALRIPRAARLTVKSVAGDMSLRNVLGGVELKEVNGDLSVRETGAIAIDTVHADFSLRGAKGDIYAKSIRGDASIRDAQGNVKLESVSDDLALRDARGNVNANVGEDVVMYLNPVAGNEYNVTAGDDILLVLSPNANATLEMQGDEINVTWPGVANEEDVTERTVVLGDGSAKVTLKAGSDVRVTNQLNAGESADEFGNFAGINFDWSGLGEKISRRVEEATRRAQQRVEEASRRAQRHAEQASRRADRKTHHHGPVGFNFTFDPRSAAKAEPVSDDERLAILKMLQEKKITADQAEQLLAALEGGK